MRKGWYILNYHNISWEDNVFTRGIGPTYPPDIFRSHLRMLNQYSRFISIQEGYKKYLSDSIEEPLVSFWFDDGYKGVRNYAYPLLENYDLTGAIAVNSNFMLRKELFWRCKLNFINHADGMRVLRTKLKVFGYKIDQSVKSFVLNNFSKDIINVIDQVYDQFTNPDFRRDAFRIFDNIDGIKYLYNNGWVISNHSASHYPIGEDSYIDYFKEEFEKCEKDIYSLISRKTSFWVLPFSRQTNISLKLFEVFQNSDKENRNLVLVGNKFNLYQNYQQKVLYRISLPSLDDNELIKHLINIPVNNDQ